MPTQRSQRERRRRERARAVVRATLGALLLAMSMGGLSWIGDHTAPAGSLVAHVQSEDASASEPDTSETVVIALPQLPRKFDPLDDMEPWAERIGDDLIFEGLVRRSGDRHPWVEPALADRCEVDREFAVTTVSCHIPAGIRFHDGSEVTIDDVLYSLRYWQAEQHAWLRDRNGLANLHRIEIADGPPGARDYGRWVKLRFAKPEPLALEALSAIKIVPMAAHRGRSFEFAQAPIGTGPMRLTELDTDRIVLERFDEHHDPSRRHPSRKLVFRALDDGSAALMAMRRGELHLLPEMAPSHVPVELGKPGMSARMQAWLVSPPSYDVLLWNVGKGVTAELEIREALDDAIPRASITRRLYGTPSLLTWGPVDLMEPMSIDLYALADIKAGEPVRGGLLMLPSTERDQRGAARADAGLRALGWTRTGAGMRRRDGSKPLRVTLAWNDDATRAGQVGAAIREAWQALGVHAPESAISWRFLMTALQRGDYRAALLHFGSHSDEDLFHMFHSRGALNLAGVADGPLDAALEAYRHAVDRPHRDAAKRSIARRLDALHVVSVLHAPTHVTLATRRLDGVTFVDDLPRLDRLVLVDRAIDWREEARKRAAAGQDPGFCHTCR